MIASLLPPAVAFAEEFGDPPGGFLFAEEAELVARSVPVRRREFTTVRVCARRALADLGLGPVPLLPGTRGAPQWPAGVVGSMTHCVGYRASVVARDRDVTAIGIDAEPAEPLVDGLLETIALPGEQAHVRRLLRARPQTAWDRLLFSAKESVYKATFPATGVRLDFSDAAITIDPFEGTFRARLLVPGLVVGGRWYDSLDGKWSATGGLLLTAITVADG
ncbi:4'-phosphopantetheinyl transferase superfamily protein (plasmid) [Streptomyces sp. NBC_00335]|uniref:4'-phosphopantetheinyl transferase family protein n=1 Tax=unclassified Streptomyces TaxID=2593676 RepID=UPI00224D49C0|nr:MULTISPECIES: 4'-phosphopantetheinyl transferase superfamily protein [unclassified Streptomyces]MCX5409989.1 4'-phosphopantetheinyl transferase superfamily protein [Streptomyces sp. NBC_00086]